jgi:hypothetical protein
MRDYYYKIDLTAPPGDRQAIPHTGPFMEWAVWHESMMMAGKQICRHDRVEGYLVSTIFLAMNHDFGGEGPPILWETMVLGEGEHAGGQWRHSSEKEALGCHAAVLASLLTDLGVIDVEAVEVRPLLPETT